MIASSFLEKEKIPIQVKRNVVFCFKLCLAHIIFLSYLCLLVFDWLLSFLRRTTRHLLSESAKSRAWRACVLAWFACLRTCVFMRLACLRVYLLACLRACVLGLRAYLLTCLACLRACVLACVRVFISVHRKGFS